MIYPKCNRLAPLVYAIFPGAHVANLSARVASCLRGPIRLLNVRVMSKTLISPVPAPSAGSRLPWIFAAKTTLSALLALLIAFTFNLDQPQWTLLTVFIVSQPRRDGMVSAKSFFRIIGTVVGAVMALLL